MSLSKSVCEFLKRNCLGLKKFLPPTQSPLVFAASSYEDLSSPWAWVPGVGLTLLTSKTSLLNFYPPHVDVGPSFLHLSLSYQFGSMWFL